MEITPITNALISVSNKAGLEEFARTLSMKYGVKIFATGGTFKFLETLKIPAKKNEELTGMPEMLGGRVKTLHPAVFGGILARRECPEDLASLTQLNLPLFDLVVVNLYPFTEVIRKKDVTEAECIENIDIGGVALLRAAAKNFSAVTVVSSPDDYALVLAELEQYKGIRAATRRALALKAFSLTAEYDYLIYKYFTREETFPVILTLRLKRVQQLRYGENPHQKGAFYSQLPEEELLAGKTESSIVRARQLHGKELSYNNLADLDAALELVREFEEPAVAIIKHANPCGVARGKSLTEAYLKALECDPVSAFGGIIALNRPVDRTTAEEISKIFTEAIIAPQFNQEVLAILTQKKNLRLLEVGELTPRSSALVIRSITGGMLVQDRDLADVTPADLQVVTRAKPTSEDLEALIFAWKVVKWVKSNAIVFCDRERTIGIGAGQMSRIDSARFAAEKARSSLAGTYMASDAFFPFRDCVDFAAEKGVRAIIQPGGSVRDEEVIAAADEHNLIMVFTGIRHFRH